MATIGKIRERSGIVIIVIGIAMIGFIATDFISNGFKIRGGGQKGIGMVYSEDIQPEEFQQSYENALTNQRQQMGPNAEISSFVQGQVSGRVWDQIVNSRILMREANMLGLEVSGDEIRYEALKADPHPLLVQAFTGGDPTKYDKAQIKSFFDNFSSQPEEMQLNWSRFENEFVVQRISDKLSALVNSSVFVTDLEAAENFKVQNQTVSFQYVPLFLNSIKDEQVQIDDADYQKYYDAHKEEFKKNEGRSFQYVEFSIQPTKSDSIIARDWMAKQQERFSKTTNDSAFVAGAGNSTYTGQYLPRGSYPAEVEDQIFSADSGTVIGPVYQKGNFVLVKVKGSKPDSLYSFHASHILVRPEGATDADTAAAMKKAQNLVARIKAGEDFSKLATEESQDPGSASKGGDLGWFREGVMVKNFNNAVKTMHKGDVRIVKSEFGIHIIKATSDPSKKLVLAAMLEKPVTAGSATVQAGYNQASKFRTSVNNLDDFNAATKKMGITARVAENIGPNEYNIAGLDNPRDLIRWAYNDDTKVGDITDPRQVGSKYIVAILTKKTEEGYQELSEVKDQIKPMVINEKKKEMLADKLKEAMQKNNNLASLATAVQSNVNTVQSVTFANPTIPNMNNEVKLVGYAFGSPKGKVTGPIEGESGSFVIQVTEINDIQPPKNMDQQRQQMQQQISTNAITSAMDALKQLAKVKDYRYLYY
jgi:peptidyl-prolyl cis-trans isomerase D